MHPACFGLLKFGYQEIDLLQSLLHLITPFHQNNDHIESCRGSDLIREGGLSENWHRPSRIVEFGSSRPFGAMGYSSESGITLEVDSS